MNIKNNITNFLYDKNYFISLYDKCIYVFNYLDLSLLTEEKIILKLENFRLIIEGTNLFITRLEPKELLIKGIVNNIGIIYE